MVSDRARGYMETVEAGDLAIGDGHPPRIMGVLNVSRESPYDPSVYDDSVAAARYIEQSLVAEGADIVDVGLESANKRFETLSDDEELDRLDVAIETIENVDADVVFSIETRYARVADAALDRGFDMINDICGFADPEMASVARDHNAAVVKMASPPDVDRPGAVNDVDWARERSPAWANNADYVDKLYASLERGGLTEKTIVDPAFGGWSESKTLANDRETFVRLREFRALDRPILVSINRKNFLKTIADRETDEALPVSLAATSMAVERGAHIIRTHDVEETRDAALVGRDLGNQRVATTHVKERDVTGEAELQRLVQRVGGDWDAVAGRTGKVVSVTDLTATDRDRLRERATQHGLATVGTGSLVLVGPVEAFDQLRQSLLDAPSPLSEVGEAIGSVVNNEKTYTGWK
jgi:dihydropteroate synthase